MKNVKTIVVLFLAFLCCEVVYGQRTVWILSGVYTDKNGSLELRKHGDVHNTLVSFSVDSAFVLSIADGEFAFPYHVKKDVLYFGSDNQWKPVGRFVGAETLLFFDRDRDVKQYKIAKRLATPLTNEGVRKVLRGKTYAVHYADLFQESSSSEASDKLTFGPKADGSHANGEAFYAGIESFGNAHYLFIDYRGGYFFQIRDVTEEAITLISTHKQEHDVVLPRVWAE